MTCQSAPSPQDSGDELLAVAAAHRLGLIGSDEWPLAAAHLIAAGFEGDATVALAGLPRTASGWEVDQLVPAVLAEAGVPSLTVEEAADVAARLFAQVAGGNDYLLIRTFASLAPELNYPGGRIREAYWLAEWLDCDCHRGSAERAQADRFEEELRRLPALRIPTEFARALIANPDLRPPAQSHA